jgi:hypothetical protein
MCLLRVVRFADQPESNSEGSHLLSRERKPKVELVGSKPEAGRVLVFEG